MLDTAICLREPITALCASQVLDMSMRTIQLTTKDWEILLQLQRLFAIFVKPSTKLQAHQYPTLNMAIPFYLRMVRKLQALQDELGANSAIGKACIAA